MALTLEEYKELRRSGFSQDELLKYKNKSRKEFLIDNARKQELISQQEAAKAKKDAGFAQTILRLTGMEKTADTASKMIARSKNPFLQKAGFAVKTDQERAFIPEPTTREKLGAAANIGLLLYPPGKVAQGARFAGTKLFGAKAGKIAGKVAPWSAGGYLADAALKLEDNKNPTPGLATAITTAIPLSPILARGASKAIGKLGSEALGTTTGTSGGTIREAYEAAKAGGERAKAFTEALRGKITPDELVDEAKSALGEIIQKRSNDYKTALSRIEGMRTQIDTTPIYSAIRNGLSKFGIKEEVVDGVKTLDFSRSTLRFDKKAQDEIRTIYEEMKTFGRRPGDNTPIGIDSLKRAFGDLYSDSSSARAFVQSIKSETRKLLDDVPGYKEMSKAYEESTGLIKEIQKGLSLGNKASVDTAFRKLNSVLRTNNELRKQLLEELNTITGGELTSKIAGQQLSETLPRGAARVIGAATAGAGLLSGIGVVALLKLAMFTSPRVVGEFARALGITAKAANKLIEAIGKPKGFKLPGDYFFEKLQKGIDKVKGKGGLSIQEVSNSGTRRGFGTGAGRGKKIDGISTSIGEIMSGKKVKESILNEMADFTEYAAKQRNKIRIEYIADEIRARKIAQKLGINPDISNWELAKRFGKILEKHNWSR